MTGKPIQFEAHPVDYIDALVGGRFRAWGERVVDGDTFDVFIDQGFRSYEYLRVRLDGIDTPEIFGVKEESEEFARGQEAKRFVEDYLLEQPILLRSLEEQTFNRWVARVWVLGGEGGWADLAKLLRAEGFGTDG